LNNLCVIIHDMSPEYLVAAKVNLRNPEEAEQMAQQMRELPGVEIAAVRPLVSGELDTLSATFDPAAFFRKQRLELGITQLDLAQRSGVSRGYINKLERGLHDASTMRKSTLEGLIMGIGWDPEDERTIALVGAFDRFRSEQET
jgi:hypothetical protein